jgi:hypothetical protein
VTANNKPYDGTITASIASCTLAGVLTGDTVTCSAATGSFASANVGTGIAVTASGITLGGAAAGNYSLSSNTAATTANITPALVTATAGSYNGVYDGAAHAPSACLLTGAYTVGLSCANNPSSVGPGIGSGTITPTVSGTGLTNFAITPVNGAWSITAKAASVTPNAASKVYGTADPILSGTLIGFLAADGVTATYSRTAGQTVGTYTISATLSSVPAAALANYAITYNTAAFTITPLAASVTPNAASKVAGTADPFPLTTGTLTGFLPADSVTAIYTRVAGEAVGTYTISATLAPAGVLANYTITYNTAVFTIRDFTIAVAPASRTIGAGSTTTYTLTLTPLAGLTGPVALSCSGYTPRANSCVVAPATVTFGGSQTATATVTTRAGAPGRGTFTMTFTGNYGGGVRIQTTTATLTTN